MIIKILINSNAFLFASLLLPFQPDAVFSSSVYDTFATSVDNNNVWVVGSSSTGSFASTKTKEGL